jgi:hypothetical protein
MCSQAPTPTRTPTPALAWLATPLCREQRQVHTYIAFSTDLLLPSLYSLKGQDSLFFCVSDNLPLLRCSVLSFNSLFLMRTSSQLVATFCFFCSVRWWEHHRKKARVRYKKKRKETTKEGESTETHHQRKDRRLWTQTSSAKERDGKLEEEEETKSEEAEPNNSSNKGGRKMEKKRLDCLRAKQRICLVLCSVVVSSSHRHLT